MSLFMDGQQKARRSRMMELAGMLKEKSKGTIEELSVVLDLFSVKEGVSPATAKVYLEQFKNIGLVICYEGSKIWKYNQDVEWEVFKITINNGL